MRILLQEAVTDVRSIRSGCSSSVPYHVDGSFSIDAGALGQPAFGPMRLFQGRLGR